MGSPPPARAPAAAARVRVRAPSRLQRLIDALPQGRTLPAEQWRTRHRAMIVLLSVHVVALPLLALAYGATPFHAVADGLVVAAFAGAALLRLGSRRARTLIVSAGLLTSSAVLVHVMEGATEAHFHFFVMVTVLTLYEDWSPFLMAIAYVFLHHGIGSAVANEAIFDHGGSPWKWAAVHAFFISAAAAACIVNWRATELQRLDVTTASDRYRAVIDALEEGVVHQATDGTILTSNPSADRILGLGAGSARDLGAWEVVQPDGTPLPSEERPSAIVRATGRPETGTGMRVRGPDGRHTWLSVSARALPAATPGPPYEVVVSFADVTAEREASDALSAALAELEERAEALERSNAELEQFAYVASHDLSEPLRMISSFLQLLQRRYEGRLDEDADAFIGYAVDGAQRMRALIDDLLVFSRVGTSEEARERVDTAGIVDATLRSLAPVVEQSDARVEVGALPEVWGDPMQLGQLFQNLMANALKFRDGDAPLVRVDAAREDGAWRFVVADNGIGVSPDHRERIFKMFQRLHTREAYEGTGIGLAVCRKIVERHGGRIWHEPNPGGGARFCFTLPDRPA